MTATVHWAASLTAMSSIVHAGDTHGTTTLLRRETIATPDGMVQIPLVSGNALRGRLRRIGEELLRDALQLEGELSLPAAYALRNGGSLHKTSAASLSGRRLGQIRRLVPQIGVFGCAAGDALIDGALQVGKAVPQVTETAHLTGVRSAVSAFDLVQLEEYSHLDDLDTPDDPDEEATGGNQMRFAVETFPAGTVFSTYFRLDRATDLQIAFFSDILDTFARAGRIGGRLSIGHGRVTLDHQCELVAGWYDDVDWRAQLTRDRDAVLSALEELR